MPFTITFVHIILSVFFNIVGLHAINPLCYADESIDWVEEFNSRPLDHSASGGRDAHNNVMHEEDTKDNALNKEKSRNTAMEKANFLNIDENSARKFLNSLSGAINTRNKRVVADFFRFYTAKNAYFIIDSTAFKGDSETEIINKSQKRFNTEEYISYLSDIIGKPHSYSFQVNFENLALLGEAGTYLVTYSTEEKARYRDIKAEANGEVKVNWRETTVYGRCNITMIQSANPLITGSNCVEKIYKSKDNTNKIGVN